MELCFETIDGVQVLDTSKNTFNGCPLAPQRVQAIIRLCEEANSWYFTYRGSSHLPEVEEGLRAAMKQAAEALEKSFGLFGIRRYLPWM